MLLFQFTHFHVVTWSFVYSVSLPRPTLSSQTLDVFASVQNSTVYHAVYIKVSATSLDASPSEHEAHLGLINNWALRQFTPDWLQYILQLVDGFLARDAFVRTNRRFVVLLHVRPSVCLSVCSWSVRLFGTGVHSYPKDSGQWGLLFLLHVRCWCLYLTFCWRFLGRWKMFIASYNIKYLHEIGQKCVQHQNSLWSLSFRLYQSFFLGLFEPPYRHCSGLELNVIYWTLEVGLSTPPTYKTDYVLI